MLLANPAGQQVGQYRRCVFLEARRKRISACEKMAEWVSQFASRKELMVVLRQLLRISRFSSKGCDPRFFGWRTALEQQTRCHKCHTTPATPLERIAKSPTHILQHVGEHVPVFHCLAASLPQVGHHGVAGVADKNGLSLRPALGELHSVFHKKKQRRRGHVWWREVWPRTSYGVIGETKHKTDSHRVRVVGVHSSQFCLTGGNKMGCFQRGTCAHHRGIAWAHRTNYCTSTTTRHKKPSSLLYRTKTGQRLTRLSSSMPVPGSLCNIRFLLAPIQKRPVNHFPLCSTGMDANDGGEFKVDNEVVRPTGTTKACKPGTTRTDTSAPEIPLLPSQAQPTYSTQASGFRSQARVAYFGFSVSFPLPPFTLTEGGLS